MRAASVSGNNPLPSTKPLIFGSWALQHYQLVVQAVLDSVIVRMENQNASRGQGSIECE
jgi:hypothetical protein